MERSSASAFEGLHAIISVKVMGPSSVTLIVYLLPFASHLRLFPKMRRECDANRNASDIQRSHDLEYNYHCVNEDEEQIAGTDSPYSMIEH